ncbi:MAG TPA: ribonuclease HI family protein [Candidatus Paceibacterota bacterium]
MDSIVIYTDGGARGNPGPAGAGIVIYEGEKKISELKQYLGERQTNNWAEYEAVAIALAEARRLGFSERALEIRMDSMLVVEQLMGNWKIKEPALKMQATKVRALLSYFPDSKFVHVRRELNAEADALVNEVLDEAVN